MSSLAPALALALLVLAPIALAGSPEAPEVADPAGDCALPYAERYLDVIAAWIDREDDDSFVVNVQLAAFDERLAEGAGYAVQFEHQGLRWGVLAVHQETSDGGWSFYTGQVDEGRAATQTFAPAVGHAEGVRIDVRFAKSIFPHDHPNDRELRAFWVGTADLRPAYPFLLATDGVVAGSSDGKWLTCDEATSGATYAFARGQHSHQAASGSAAQATAASTETIREHGAPAPPAEEAPDPRETPFLATATIAGALLGAMIARQRRH